jgi:ABC-type Fe3+ transport system permease subunit
VRKLRIAQSLRRVGIALAVLVVLTLPSLAFGQGCALCYTQAAASGARMIRALRSGIVILIIPPLSMCLGAIALAYRKRNQFNQVDTRVEPGSDW